MDTIGNIPVKQDPVAMRHFIFFNLISLFFIVTVINFIYFLPQIKRQVIIFRASRMERALNQKTVVSKPAFRYLSFRSQFAKWLEKHDEYRHDFELAALRSSVHRQKPILSQAQYREEAAAITRGNCYFECLRQGQDSGQYCQSRCAF